MTTGCAHRTGANSVLKSTSCIITSENIGIVGGKSNRQQTASKSPRRLIRHYSCLVLVAQLHQPRRWQFFLRQSLHRWNKSGASLFFRVSTLQVRTGKFSITWSTAFHRSGHRLTTGLSPERNWHAWARAASLAARRSAIRVRCSAVSHASCSAASRAWRTWSRFSALSPLCARNFSQAGIEVSSWRFLCSTSGSQTRREICFCHLRCSSFRRAFRQAFCRAFRQAATTREIACCLLNSCTLSRSPRRCCSSSCSLCRSFLSVFSNGVSRCLRSPSRAEFPMACRSSLMDVPKLLAGEVLFSLRSGGSKRRFSCPGRGGMSKSLDAAPP